MVDTVATVNALNYFTVQPFLSIFFSASSSSVFIGNERAEAISQRKTITEDFFIFFFIFHSNLNVQVHFI